MLKLRLTANQVVLEILRDLPIRAQRNLKRKLQTELKTELQNDVDALFATPPGPVSEPFQFGSRESKIYYLILLREHPELADGQHWIRTGDIAGSFEVRVSGEFRQNLITIANILSQSTGTEPYPAKYVYGPWAAAGHVNTGWPAQMQTIWSQLTEKLRVRIYELWVEAVNEAVRGQG